MKNTQCPTRKYCFDYGSCESCDVGMAIKRFYNKIKRRDNRIEKQKNVLDILRKYPALLTAFAYDGTWTWKQYQETYCEEDRTYIGANLTEKEFNTVREWLLSYADRNEKDIAEWLRKEKEK